MVAVTVRNTRPRLRNVYCGFSMFFYRSIFPTAAIHIVLLPLDNSTSPPVSQPIISTCFQEQVVHVAQNTRCTRYQSSLNMSLILIARNKLSRKNERKQWHRCAYGWFLGCREASLSQLVYADNNTYLSLCRAPTHRARTHVCQTVHWTDSGFFNNNLLPPSSL